MANQSTLTKIKGPLEIVSLSGTFDENLSPHVHIAIAKATGETIGGHLPSLEERK
jgi:predicted DNA-binding protein with PD1-like motif